MSSEQKEIDKEAERLMILDQLADIKRQLRHIKQTIDNASYGLDAVHRLVDMVEIIIKILGE